MEAVDSAIETNLFTIISNTHHSWHVYPLQGFGVMLLQKNVKLQGLNGAFIFLEHIKAQISSFFRGEAPLPLDQLLLGFW